MKRLKAFVLILFFPVCLFSQGGVEVVPFAGYFFGGSVNYYYYNNSGKLKVPNSLDYGVSVLVPVQSLVDLEVNYTRTDKVTATFSGFNTGLADDEFYVVTNYFQIGGVSKFYNGGNSMVQPFGSLSIGATWFDISPSENSDPSYTYQDVWRFSAIVGLGVKLMFSERVGIMLRGRLMMPMTFGGVGMYFGTGGSGVSVNSWVAPLQGDFNGGLIIKLGGS